MAWRLARFICKARKYRNLCIWVVDQRPEETRLARVYVHSTYHNLPHVHRFSRSRKSEAYQTNIRIPWYLKGTNRSYFYTKKKEIELLPIWRKTVSPPTLMTWWKYQPTDWNAVLMEEPCTTAATAIPNSPALRPPATGCGFV